MKKAENFLQNSKIFIHCRDNEGQTCVLVAKIDHMRLMIETKDTIPAISRQQMKIFEFCKKFSAFFIGHNNIRQNKKKFFFSKNHA